jgi:hypothetical protein
MKQSEKPQFSTKWWDGQRPGGVKTPDLDKALAKAEKALAEQRKKKDDAQAIESCIGAIEAIGPSAEKTIKLCDKNGHKDLAGVLRRFEGVIGEEKSRLEGLKEDLDEKGGGDDEDDGEDEGKLFEKDYLYKMIKMLKSGGKQYNFGFGLNPNAPESSRLILKRKGKPEALFKALKKTGEFNNRLLTYGVAQADPADGKTLVFRLEKGANEPPRIMKLGREFLRSDKGLKFKKLSVVLPGGKTLNDTEPDSDE